MQDDTKEFVDLFLKELREDNAAVFVGAGLSRSAGYVDWRGLLDPIAKQLGLDVAKEHDLVAVAQFHLNANGNNRHQLNQLLVDQFADLNQPSLNHEILARLPIRTFWTTNYDRLIEKALEAGGKRVDAKYTVPQLARTVRGRDAVVYKMHGDIEHADQAILTKDDYEGYAGKFDPFITALAGDLVEKTFLFLGFSFTDPNIDYVLARIRGRFSANQRQHFCLVKRYSRTANESQDDFDYATRKQSYIIQDLLRFNIRTILVDDYADITDILNSIDKRFRRRTVFIGGSATDFAPWGREKTEDFFVRLAAALIDQDFRVASGFGLGIGSSVVTGAVQQIYSSKSRSIDEQLVLRPFPAGIADSKERQQTFERYRAELLDQAGIALLFMGNKLDGASIINSDGVRAEFDQACAKGLRVLPIGASGWMAAELWKEMKAELSKHFPEESSEFEPLFDAIGTSTDEPLTLIDPILKLMSMLRKE